MKRPTQRLLLALLGLVVFGFLGAGAAVALLVYAVGDLGGSPGWSEDAVPERSLPAVFGVRLPVRPLRYQSRSLGFQDHRYEVLVQLPPGSAPAFLEANHLERGDTIALEGDAAEQVRAWEPSTPPLKTTSLELPPALLADGGAWGLRRSGALLEAEGKLWVHLVAFDW